MQTSIISFLLLFIVTYPANVVLYLFTFNIGSEVYSAISIILIINLIIFDFSVSKYRTNKPICNWVVVFCILCLLGYFVNGSKTAARDSLTMLAIWFFIKLPPRLIVEVVRKYIVYHAIFLLISGLAISTWIFGFIDLDQWHVSRLSFINNNNSAVVRDNYGDFVYHMPFYLTLIPIDISNNLTSWFFGMRFSRLPFMYAEPSYTWMYTVGLFCFSIGDQNMPYRKWLLLMMFLALLLSFSVQGILSLIIAGFIGLCFSSFSLVKRNPRTFIIFLFTVILVGQIFGLNLAVLRIIGESKVEYALFLENTLSLETLTANLSLLGGDESLLTNAHVGSLSILVRYGLLGSGILVLFWIWLIDRSIFLLSFKQVSFRMCFLPLSVLVSCFIAFRIPQINQMIPIILLSATNYLYSEYVCAATDLERNAITIK